MHKQERRNKQAPNCCDVAVVSRTNARTKESLSQRRVLPANDLDQLQDAKGTCGTAVLRLHNPSTNKFKRERLRDTENYNPSIRANSPWEHARVPTWLPAQPYIVHIHPFPVSTRMANGNNLPAAKFRCICVNM